MNLLKCWKGYNIGLKYCHNCKKTLFVITSKFCKYECQQDYYLKREKKVQERKKRRKVLNGFTPLIDSDDTIIPDELVWVKEKDKLFVSKYEGKEKIKSVFISNYGKKREKKIEEYLSKNVGVL